MDTFRRVILPVIVIVVLLAALVFRLSSCSSDSSKNSPAAESTASPSGTETSSSPSGSTSPTPPYSAKEIKSIYESLGLDVIEIREAGDVTMVHYDKPTGVPGEIISRFDWFDRKTGARELVYGWAYTDKFDIGADKSFAVLTTGRSYVDGALSFPELYRAKYEEIDGAVKYTGAAEKYYAPIMNGYTVGTDRHESLTGIYVNPGYVSFGFAAQPGYESEFYTAYSSVPKMDIKIEDGYCVITLYKTTPAKGAGDLSVKDNSYCSFVSMTLDGENTVVRLKLNDSVTRYNVSTELSPENSLPYAVLEFTSMDYDYPAGW